MSASDTSLIEAVAPAAATEVSFDFAAARPTPSADNAPAHVQRGWPRQVAADLVGLADIMAVLAGNMLPAVIYGQAGGIVSDWWLLTQSGLAASIIVFLLLRSWGMYNTAKLYDFPLDPGRLFGALFLAMAGIMGLGLPHAIRDGHTWIWFTVALSASYTLILLVRSIAHPILQQLTRAGYFNERVAVFGAGHVARRVHDHLKEAGSGVHFVGVYDDRSGQDRLNPEGLTVAGRIDDLIADVRAGHVDRVIIALPQAAAQRMSHVASRLADLPVSLHIVTHIASDLLATRDGGHKVSTIGPVGLIDVNARPFGGWRSLAMAAAARMRAAITGKS